MDQLLKFGVRSDRIILWCIGINIESEIRFFFVFSEALGDKYNLNLITDYSPIFRYHY